MTDAPTMNIDQLLTKLTKIQELVEHGATEGEVAAAAGRMQVLLTKYNLTIELVKMHNGTRQIKPTRFFVPVTGAMWIQRLANGIAKANYGKAIHTSDNGQEVIAIICHREDWIIIWELFNKFSELIMKMAPIQYESYRSELINAFNERYPDFADAPGRGPYFTPKRTWCNDWRNGCTDGISAALMQARRDGEQQTEGSSALVVLKDAAVRETFQEFYPRAQRRHSVQRNSGARDRGYATGQSLGRGTSIAG